MTKLGFAIAAEPGYASDYVPVPKNSLKDQVVAITRNLAKAQINWTVEERKLFTMVLTQIRWAESGNSNIVELKKKEILECLNLKINVHAQSTYIRKAFQKLARDSEVHWTDPKDKERWLDAPLILSRASERGKIFVEINPYFMPHFEELLKDKSFITMFSTDMYHFSSRFSYTLFDELRIHYDSRTLTNHRFYTTKELKKMFGLKKKDYTRKDGSFNRFEFEHRTLEVAIKEINEGKMMAILPFGTKPEGGYLFYRKHYENNKVTGYEFRYLVRPRKVEDTIEETE